MCVNSTAVRPPCENCETTNERRPTSSEWRRPHSSRGLATACLWLDVTAASRDLRTAVHVRIRAIGVVLQRQPAAALQCILAATHQRHRSPISAMALASLPLPSSYLRSLSRRPRSQRDRLLPHRHLHRGYLPHRHKHQQSHRWRSSRCRAVPRRRNSLRWQARSRSTLAFRKTASREGDAHLRLNRCTQHHRQAWEGCQQQRVHSCRTLAVSNPMTGRSFRRLPAVRRRRTRPRVSSFLTILLRTRLTPSWRGRTGEDLLRQSRRTR